MKINELRPPKGATKKRKRVGRGSGSGHGKTSCRGSKGANARAGGSGLSPGFEGGQMPLARRLPKRGFTNIFKQRYAVVNIRDLQRFEKGSVVDIKALMDSGLVKQLQAGIKLLGEGEIQHPLTVQVHACSRSAQQKIEAAGGKVETVRI
jgi:large subunit ribosomal protein L15